MMNEFIDVKSLKLRKLLFGINLDELIILLIFTLSPVFDAMTGFLVLHGIMSEGALATPSQVGKFLSVFLMLIKILKNGNKDTIYTIFLFSSYIIIIEFIATLYYETPLYGLLYGFVQLYKVIYLMLCFFFLKELFIRRKISSEELIYLIIKSAIIYSMILIGSTLLGFNSSTYATGTFGTKGVFASGNGLSIYLSFSSFIAAFNYFKRGRTIKQLLAFMLIWISATIVGTKASIAFLLINTIVIFFYSKKKTRFFILLFFCLSFSFLINRFSVIFEVIIYRYKQADNLLAFLSSGRDAYRDGAFKIYNTSGIKAFRIFFGSGAFVSFRTNPADMKAFDTLERDFYDIFFMYGINMLIIYFIYIFKYSVSGILKKNLFFTIGFLCVAGYSLLAGHTLFNTMSGLGIVVFPLLIKYLDYDKKNN